MKNKQETHDVELGTFPQGSTTNFEAVPDFMKNKCAIK